MDHWHTPALNRALDVAVQVAPTDITVLITGESGTGKICQRSFIIIALESIMNIAVNCGAIPEGTIDSGVWA